VDGAAFSRRQLQVQTGRMVGAAAEALPVVAAEQRAGRRCVRVADGGNSVLRRLDGTPSGGLLAHGWTLPAHGVRPGATLEPCRPR
jgi:hypothetical protein